MYIRDESKKHNASVGVILISPVILVATIIGFVYAIIGILGIVGIFSTSSATSNLLVSAILLIIGVVWDCICKLYFNFYENCKLDFKQDSIIYTYNLNKALIASSNITTKITIKNLKKFKLKGRHNIIFYGDVVKKAPLRNDKQLSKIELPIDFTEREEILYKLNKLSEV